MDDLTPELIHYQLSVLEMINYADIKPYFHCPITIIMAVIHIYNIVVTHFSDVTISETS